MYHAHSAPPGGKPQSVKEHLSEVARRAREFADPFGAGDEAELAGLLHDIGKYTRVFQERLQGRANGLDHWSPGAWIALSDPARAIAAALAIQGHHVGLQKGDRASLRAMEPGRLQAMHPLGLKLTEAATEPLRLCFQSDGLRLPQVAKPLCSVAQMVTAAAMLDVRMLYSALVDADFLDTERHFHAERRPGLPLQPERALALVQARVTALRQQSGSSTVASPKVQSVRDDLWAACLEAAAGPPGLYTLSAPTGSGKTLSMLGFALQHAVVHASTTEAGHPRFRRIIMVVPYLSIIDQTVNLYRSILAEELGAEYILEHHSLAGTRLESAPEGGDELDSESEARQRARQLAENWDAPLIVTTSVQFLESLFANRPSACRKLHNLANSIVLFDEVQTLPIHLTVPTLATLSWLAKRYGATIVFSTATQPAFSHLDEHVRALGHPESGWQPREIVPMHYRLFERTGEERRTRVHWPSPGERTSWDELAARVAEEVRAAEANAESSGQTLCVVNMKRHALALVDLLRERGVERLRHLSTSMCPAHRAAVLSEIKGWLDPAHPEPCCLVATQCIEAGVDVDFATVYRALAPLDAIAQAAGRCNRHGRRPVGDVVVFRPDDEERLYPTDAYQQAALVTDSLLRRRGPEGMDLYDPELFATYYRELYDLARPQEQREALRDAIRAQDFPEVARLYRLIEKDAVNLLVRYPEAESEVEALAAEVRREGLTASWVRRARPYSVAIYRPDRAMLQSSFLEPVPLRGKGRAGEAQDWFLCLDPECYDPDLGLNLPAGSRSLVF